MPSFGIALNAGLHLFSVVLLLIQIVVFSCLGVKRLQMFVAVYTAYCCYSICEAINYISHFNDNTTYSEQPWIVYVLAIWDMFAIIGNMILAHLCFNIAACLGFHKFQNGLYLRYNAFFHSMYIIFSCAVGLVDFILFLLSCSNSCTRSEDRRIFSQFYTVLVGGTSLIYLSYRLFIHRIECINVLKKSDISKSIMYRALLGLGAIVIIGSFNITKEFLQRAQPTAVLTDAGKLAALNSFSVDPFIGIALAFLFGSSEECLQLWRKWVKTYCGIDLTPAVNYTTVNSAHSKSVSEILVSIWNHKKSTTCCFVIDWATTRLRGFSKARLNKVMLSTSNATLGIQINAALHLLSATALLIQIFVFSCLGVKRLSLFIAAYCAYFVYSVCEAINYISHFNDNTTYSEQPWIIYDLAIWDIFAIAGNMTLAHLCFNIAACLRFQNGLYMRHHAFIHSMYIILSFMVGFVDFILFLLSCSSSCTRSEDRRIFSQFYTVLVGGTSLIYLSYRLFIHRIECINVLKKSDISKSILYRAILGFGAVVIIGSFNITKEFLQRAQPTAVLTDADKLAALNSFSTDPFIGIALALLFGSSEECLQLWRKWIKQYLGIDFTPKSYSTTVPSIQNTKTES